MVGDDETVHIADGRQRQAGEIFAHVFRRRGNTRRLVRVGRLAAKHVTVVLDHRCRSRTP